MRARHLRVVKLLYPLLSPPLHSQVFSFVTSASSSARMTDQVSTRVKIYTKTGDKGESSLYNGQRLAKDESTFQALGDVDELNSALGIAREYCQRQHEDVGVQLETIQSRLLDAGSSIATPTSTSSEHKLQRVRFDAHHVSFLEGWIDAMDESLPPLTNFILPSGGLASAHLHLARSICRRAERSVVPLVRSEAVDVQVGIYLNRLSDYLFTAARYSAMREGRPETIYKKA